MVCKGHDTGIATTVNAIQAVGKSPLKKLFSIDIAKDIYHKKLSEEFGVSPSSIKRKLKNYPPYQYSTFPTKSGSTNGYHVLGEELWPRPFYGC